ncbi:hypothetical protein scyTo_0001235, partial [Scyliorhinus torazame]|nr:hypothetical protein [Scyliorhinus torazame]
QKTVLFQFVVKFFPPDPGQLQDELTRYLFAQQIKRDLVAGRLHCNDNSVALLLSHIIQAEVGDFNEEQDGTHLQSKIYIPNQERLIHKIMNFHQKLAGRTQKQLAEYMSKGDFKKVPFERRSCTVQSEEDSSVTDLELGRQVKGLPPDLVDTGQSGDTLGKVWQRPAEMGRKESAVDIVFTSELERSRPEADPVLEPSSSSVYTSYASDSGTEAKKYPVQLQKSRQSFHGNRTRKDTDADELTCGNSPEFTIRSQCFSDNFPELDVFVSQSRRVPRHISMDEEIVRPSGMARPISLPARNFLANHGLYQRAVMRGSYGNTLNAVKEEESQQDDSLQPSKRSHSQSDMKTLGLLHVPELTPMANYLPLGWRPNSNKLRPAHMLQRKDALQTTERYISSGTESSDSDSEIISPYFHPRLFGKALRSSALKGGRFSSVSLQSGEGASSDRNAAEGMSHLTIYTDFI